jgi:hypothetical protein
MGDDDIEIRAFAEKNPNQGDWDQAIRFEGDCLIGCKGRKMLNTKNLVTALNWVDYHRSGLEHIAAHLKRMAKFPEGAHGTIITSQLADEVSE